MDKQGTITCEDLITGHTTLCVKTALHKKVRRAFGVTGDKGSRIAIGLTGEEVLSPSQGRLHTNLPSDMIIQEGPGYVKARLRQTVVAMLLCDGPECAEVRATTPPGAAS